MTSIRPHPSVDTSEPCAPPVCCIDCLFDAAFQCGMVGAARCPLIEAWQDGTWPAQWTQADHCGVICSAAQPDAVLLAN